MQQLIERIGAEHPLDNQTRAIRDFVRDAEAANVGAVHVTCSESCERECVESFQHHFAEDLLASQTYATQSPLRTATLGGRYEWGATSLAEHYFVAHGAPEDALLLVIKINSHVALSRNGNDWHYGAGDGIADGPMCGALRRSLNAEQLPALVSLSESLRSEGIDRAAMLNDPTIVNPQYRGLLAATASARLQARRAVLDIQNTRHSRDTRILVIPAVTINRPDRDTEIIIGLYDAHFNSRTPHITYRGLGDNPSQYVVTSRHNLVTIRDSQIGQDREARDHRQLIAEEWKPRSGTFRISKEQSPKVFALAERAARRPTVSQEVLKTFLRLLADVAVVPTAVTLFIDGAAGIHNIYRAYRLSQGAGTEDDAEDIVNDTIARVNNMDEYQARQLMVKLSQGLGIHIEGADKVDTAAAVKETKVPQRDISRTRKTDSQPKASKSETKTAAAQKPIEAQKLETAEKSEPAILAATQELPEVELTPASSSMELQLGAGSDLQMTSMQETSLSLGSAELSSLGDAELTLGSTATKAKTPVRTPVLTTGAKADDTTGISTEARAIEDVAADVTAMDVPKIASDTASIVDTTKDVTELASGEIEVADITIKDNAKDVTVLATPSPSEAVAAMEVQALPEYNAPEIKSPEFQAPSIKVSDTPKFAAPQASLPTSQLRQPHVIQPGQSQQPPRPSEPDIIIEAELIPIDGDEDAIIIIDEQGNERR